MLGLFFMEKKDCNSKNEIGNVVDFFRLLVEIDKTTNNNKNYEIARETIQKHS